LLLHHAIGVEEGLRVDEPNLQLMSPEVGQLELVQLRLA